RRAALPRDDHVGARRGAGVDQRDEYASPRRPPDHRLPMAPGAVGGGDGRSARRPGRHGQVAVVARHDEAPDPVDLGGRPVMTGDRLLHLDDEDLGGVVGTLEIAWPPTPDVTRAVLHDIDVARSPRRRLSRTAIVLLVAAAILALAAAAAATRFVLDFGGIAIRSVPTMPTLPASPVEPAAVGHPVSVAHAEDALGSRLPIPPELGPPDQVWLQREMTSFEPQEHGIVVA